MAKPESGATYVWTSALAHPNVVEYDMSCDMIEMLNTLEELLPFPQSKLGRYSDMSDWLQLGLDSGLLTEKEHYRARFAISPLL